MSWAELSDVRCYYDVVGGGDPLVLIPGLGQTCESWTPIVPELARHFSVVIADNRGMGRSEEKRPAHHLADLSADYLELIDHLQIDRCHLVGLSLGGIIAQRFAIDHPSRVEKLVLMSTADSFSPYLREMAKLLGQALMRFPTDVFVRTVELLGSAPEYLDTHPEIVEQRIKAQCDAKINKLSVARQLRCLACSEVDPEHYRIAMPTLVLAGEFDNLIPSFYARRMAEKIPNSEFVLLSGTGHNPIDECPDRVVSRIIEFLKPRGSNTEEYGHDESAHCSSTLVETR